MPPRTCVTGWSRYSRDVTTPKLPPPPRSAQKRSGSSFALAVWNRPSAVTTSAETRLSMLSPCLPISQPRPPPRVSPPISVLETVPGRREAKGLRLVIQLAPQHAALRRHGARVRIHANAFHEREIDDETAVVGAIARRAVAATVNGNEDAERPREVDGLLNVRRAGAPDDEGRPAIDVTVPYASRLVILRLAVDDELAAQASPQVLDVGVV